MALVGCILVLNISLPHGNSYATTRSDKVGLIPKYILPVNTVDMFSKLASNPTTRDRLDVIDKLG
jgi:hypothetical protein